MLWACHLCGIFVPTNWDYGYDGGESGFYLLRCILVIVPVLGLFLHKKVTGKIWIGAVVAAVGMYMLCINESFSIGRGDAFVFVCAVLFPYIFW